MGKADKFTAMELDYISAVYPAIGPTEIARKLGRSKSAVKARIAQMGLRDRPADDGEPPAAPETTLDRLRETRTIVRQAMAQAPPAAIAGLSKEYRALCEDIDRLEAEGAGETDAIDEIVSAALGV